MNRKDASRDEITELVRTDERVGLWLHLWGEHVTSEGEGDDVGEKREYERS